MILNETNHDILLVEDNEDDAELTLMALGKSHCSGQIVRARDGVEALDYLNARGRFSDRDVFRYPKVVILDLKLPKISGFEVLKAIKGNETLKNIPVVVMTSSREAQDVSLCYELGVNSFITKPELFEHFTEVVSHLGFYWLMVNKNIE